MLLSYSGRAISFGLALCLILLSVIIGLISLGEQRRWLRRVAVLIAVLAAVGLEVTVGSATLTGDDRLLSLTLVMGLCALVLGVTLSLIENRRTPIKGKRGLPIGALIIGIGLLGSISSLIVPVIPSQLAPIEAATSTPIGAVTATATLLPTRTPRVSATATVPPTLTARPTALPTLTETPPRAVPTAINPSDTLTPVQNEPNVTLAANPTNSSTAKGTASACLITVSRNVNLRAAPSADSQLLTTIPFGTTLPGSEQVKGWWRVRFQDQEGWVTKDATTGAAECAALPTQTP